MDRIIAHTKYYYNTQRFLTIIVSNDDFEFHSVDGSHYKIYIYKTPHLLYCRPGIGIDSVILRWANHGTWVHTHNNADDIFSEYADKICELIGERLYVENVSKLKVFPKLI